MWPLPPLGNTSVFITLHSHTITLSWIEWCGKLTPLRLRAYKRIVVKNCALEDLILFNITFVKRAILNFLRVNGIDHPFVLLSLAGPAVSEQFIAVDTATPTISDFFINLDKTVQYGFQYLYPNDSGQFVFYVYAIPHTLLFQYRILMIRSELNCIKIVPHRVAFLNVYQFLQGAAFRQAQLAIDMLRYNTMIEHSFTPDIIYRMIDLSIIDQPAHQDLPFIVNAAGLFVSQEEYI